MGKERTGTRLLFHMKPMYKFIIVGLLGTFLAFLIWEWWNSHPKISPSSPLTSLNEFDKIDSILQATVSHDILAGLAIGIVKNGKVYYENGIGYSNLESKEPMTSQSLLPVASVSKLFTALTLSQIMIEKRISQDDPISFLNIDKISLSSKGGKLSFKELLNHQSGLRDFSKIDRLFKIKSNPDLEGFGNSLIQNFPSLEEKTFHYADLNSDLIGFLLQKSTGIPFDSLVKTWVLEPAGMDSTFFPRSWPTEKPQIAMGYRQTFLWKRLEPSPMRKEYLPSPSSGMISSVNDLSKAVIHFIRADLGIFQQSLDWLKAKGTDVPSGFQHIRINNSSWLGHYGEQAGYSSLLIFNQQEKLGIVILSNSRDNSDFRTNLAKKLITQLMK
ncbi:serine hydrolase domain-containing protein [Algoriphagus sp. CAU 1675]|uniref:serine hydrolase domain-containing protein n=1 Tax=Algoriphagus sp. CAU 1675 TaxID=3032597 RepID=UPI0023DCE79F|nr:serine hydrolase domain-containing protein [Algoriphagus sp. CAU 1675]MDF2158275.1 serine hydrolase [Algoriphagus sp. CAU 1675]